MYFQIFLLLTAILLATQLYFFVGSLFYAKIWYPFVIKPKLEKTTALPSAHVMVPLKGLSDRLEGVLRRYAEQDYEGTYRLTLSTESEQDPAHALVQRLANGYDHVHHVIAGLATTCGQKNQNLLGAIEADEGSDIFVFADADAHAGPTWLTHLIKPLNLGENVVSTGLPYCVLSDTGLSHVLQASLTAFQAKVIMSAGATWGGATAIWRSTFEELKVADYWKVTSVDDISMYKLMQQYNLRNLFNGKRIKLIPIPDLDHTVRTQCKDMSAVTRWFVRQVFYIKFYRRPIWYLAVWGNFGNFAVTTIAPFFILAPSRELQLYGIVGLSYLLCLTVINMSLLIIRPKDDAGFFTWGKITVIGDLFANFCLQLSIPMNSFSWAKIHYKVDYHGKVTEVIHPDSPVINPPLPESSTLEETHK